MTEYNLKYEQPPSKWTKKRICLMATGIISVIAAIVALVLIFVVGPNTAQKKLDASKVTVQAVRMFNVSNSDFSLEMTSSITAEDEATMDRFEATAFYNGDKLGTFYQPETKTKKGDNIITMTTNFKIADPKSFEKYAADMLKSDTLDWKLTGKTGVTALGVHVENLNFDKTIQLPGMSCIQKLKLGGFDLPSNGPDNKGIELHAKSLIDNPTNNTMELGHVRFITSIKSKNANEPVPIGWIQGPVALHPGKNELAMKGLVLPDEDKVSFLEEFFNTFLKGGTSTLVITGGKVQGGVQGISWVENSMKDFKIDIDFPGIPLSGTLVKGVEVLQNEVLVDDEHNRYELGSTTKVSIKPPFAFPMVVKQVKMHLEAFDPEIENGEWFAKWDTEWLDATLDQDGHSIIVKVPRQSIASMVCGGASSCAEYTKENPHVLAFKNNMGKVMKAMKAGKKTTALGLRGTNDVKLETAAGVITLYDVPINAVADVDLGKNKLVNPKDN